MTLQDYWQRTEGSLLHTPDSSRAISPLVVRTSSCVRGGDASSPARGQLLHDDLEPCRDRHADDRADQAEEGPERKDACEHGEAGDLGGLADDRRLQDVVLDRW